MVTMGTLMQGMKKLLICTMLMLPGRYYGAEQKSSIDGT
jgi:hypothetical protein